MRRLLLILLLLLGIAPLYAQNQGAIPDTTLFDQEYFAAVNATTTQEQIDHLLKARFICEKAYGTLAPVFLEVCMALGQAYEEQGEVKKAISIYEDGLVQGIGLYTTADPDVKEYFETIKDAYQQYMQNGTLDTMVVWNKIPQYYRTLKYDDDDELLDPYIMKATQDQIDCIKLVNEGKLNEAESTYLQNIKLLEEHGQKDTKIFRKSLSGLANVYASLHNYEKAKNYAGRAKFLFEQNKDYGFSYILCLSRNAKINWGLNNYLMAQLMMDVALMRLMEGIHGYDEKADTAAIVQSLDYFGTLLNNAGVIYNDTKRYNAGIAALQMGMTISDKTGNNTFVEKFNLGKAYMYKGNFAEASKYLSKAYYEAGSDWQQPEIGTFQILSDFYQKKNVENLAIEVSKALTDNVANTFSFLSASERANYWRYYELYLPIINMTIYNQQAEYAYGTIYDNILMTKGLLLRSSNLVTNAVQMSGSKAAQDEYKRLTNLKHSLLKTGDNNKRKKILAEIDQLDSHLTKEVATYKSFKENLNTHWKQIQNALGDNDIAIEFYN